MANRLLRLQKEHSEVRKRQEAFLELIEKRAEEGGDTDFTDTEKAEYDSLDSEREGFAARITREQEFRASELNIDPVTSTSTGDEQITGVTDVQQAASLPQPFSSFGEQLVAIADSTRRQNIDSRLNEIQAAIQGGSEGVPSDAGFLVQQDFTTQLLLDTYETSVIWSKADNTPIGPNSNGLKQNAIDETSRVTGSRWGGIQVYMAGEGDAATKSKPKFYQFTLTLKKMIGLYYATDELLMDTSALESVISQAFNEEFGFQLDDFAINGDGAGQPQGIVGFASTVSVAKETGQAAATIISDNVEKMYTRMMAQYLSGAEWFINQDCWPQLFKMQHTVGTGGVPVFLPAGGISGAPFGTLLGRPVRPIEQCQTVGTVGDIIFANWSQYKTIDKGGIQSARSMHVEFLTDQEVFRFILRIDGKPKRKSKLTPFKGTKTVSPFITLDTRS